MKTIVGILRPTLRSARHTAVLLASAGLVFVTGVAEAGTPLPEPADAPLTSPLVVPKSPVAQPTPPLPHRPSNPIDPTADGFAANAVPTTIVAGRTPATFAVSDTGAATYSIPLWAPPGVGSVQLNLSLVYNNRTPNGLLGLGWSLAGLSAITRCNKTWAQDGVPARVTLTLADRFCLDGQQLKLTSPGIGYGQPNSTYATEIESFSRIAASAGSIGNGPASFTVTSKHGLIFKYGTTPDSQIMAGTSGTIRTWALSQIADRVGNRINLTYANDTANGSYRIQEITYPYTASGQGPFYQMLFSYGGRLGSGSAATSDVPVGYLAGYTTREPNQLNTITIQNSGAAVIKTYNLGYAQGASNRLQLRSVQECSASNCFPPTNITYQNGARGWSSTINPAGVSAAGGPLGGPLALDLNADGRMDLLYPVVAPGNTYRWWVTFATAAGYGSPVDTQVVTSNLGPYGQIISGAFSGRGLTQLLAHSPSASVWSVYTYNGTGFTSVPTGVPVNGEYIAGDYDADGLPDLVSIVSNSVVVRRNTTPVGGAVSFAGVTETIWTTSEPQPIAPGHGGIFKAADFNGDARADILVTTILDTGFGTIAFWNVLTSNGFGAAPGATRLGGSAAVVPRLGDWNADGCTDIVSTFKIFVSDCAVAFASLSPGISNTAAIPLDWDGDGRTDLLYNNNATWYVLRSTGDGFASGVPAGVAAPTSTSWFPLEKDGDGLPDLGFMDANSGNAIKYVLHAQSGVAPDLARSFTDGLGMNQNPTYVSIAVNNHTKQSSAAFPENDYQGALYVVDQFTAADGTGSTFQNQFWYYGARMHVQGRGFEGFDSRRIYDTRNDLYTFDTFALAFPYTGMLKARSVIRPSQLYVHAWGASVANQASGGTGYEQRYFPFYSSTLEDQHEYGPGGALDGQVMTRTSRDYFYSDGYGNPTYVQTFVLDLDPGSPFANQTWQTIVNNTFLNDDGAPWCLGLPTSTTIQNVVPGQTTQTRAYQYVPDANHAYCREQQQIIEPGTPSLTVTTNLLFDTCGNVKQVDVLGRKPDGDPMPIRTTHYNYSHYTSRCQLAESVTNALSQTSTIFYDYDFGVPLLVSDPNGTAFNWTYDDFGRKETETRPDQTSSLYSYFYCNTAPCWGVNDLRFSVFRNDYASDGAPSGSEGFYWDGFERLRYNQTLHAFGTTVYDEINGYDSLGRRTVQYRPFATSSNGYSEFFYDPLNRLTNTILRQSSGAIDRTTTFAYAGRSTAVIDPLNHMTTRVTDVAGRLRRVIDPLPGGVSSYDYDAFGNLNRITDAIGAVSTSTYNLRGFMTQMIDADAGTWNFDGNSLNELVSWRDAKNQLFGAEYDPLGRMTSRTESGERSDWTWGSSATLDNIGRLEKVAGYGYSEQMFYDSIGRLSNRRITSDISYDYGYTYNSIGAVDTITYPTSPAPSGTTATRYKIKYGYSYGQPVLIQDVTQPTPATLWTLNTENDYSSPTSETLGANAVTVASGYKPWTNELTSLQAGTGGSTTNRQNLAYQWDLNGNLERRQDLNQGLTEIFSYDALNRFSSSTLNSITNFSAGYDAAGNIKRRFDIVGDYSYGDPLHPHAATAAGTEPAGITFTHDANGNVSSREDLAQTWASFNLPTVLRASVGGSTYLSTFSYGPEHQRWKQVATYLNGTETTHYIGDRLEKMTPSTTGVTSYRHYIPTPSGLTLIVARNSDATSTTTFALSDHLGSSDALVDGTVGNVGALLYRASFGAFGQRRLSNWSAGTPSPADWDVIAKTTRRGFTFHEELDNLGLTHMNGRVYDPAVGRFLSVDPLIGDLGDSQSVNPYAYVGNRPLSFTDPTGYDGCTASCAAVIKFVVTTVLKFAFGSSGPPPPPPANALPGQSAQGPAQPCTAGSTSPACGGRVEQASGPGGQPGVVIVGATPGINSVAGEIPHRGRSTPEIRKDTVDTAAEWLRRQGIIVFNPHYDDQWAVDVPGNVDVFCSGNDPQCGRDDGSKKGGHAEGGVGGNVVIFRGGVDFSYPFYAETADPVKRVPFDYPLHNLSSLERAIFVIAHENYHYNHADTYKDDEYPANDAGRDAVDRFREWLRVQGRKPEPKRPGERRKP